jgi:hypothetical protein
MVAVEDIPKYLLSRAGLLPQLQVFSVVDYLAVGIDNVLGALFGDVLLSHSVHLLGLEFNAANLPGGVGIGKIFCQRDFSADGGGIGGNQPRILGVEVDNMDSPEATTLRRETLSVIWADRGLWQRCHYLFCQAGRLRLCCLPFLLASGCHHHCFPGAHPGGHAVVEMSGRVPTKLAETTPAA